MFLTLVVESTKAYIFYIRLLDKIHTNRNLLSQAVHCYFTGMVIQTY